MASPCSPTTVITPIRSALFVPGLAFAWLVTGQAECQDRPPRSLRPHLRGRLDAHMTQDAGEVTTVFSNQRLFTDSVRDFYAYLAGILSRYDLA
jgi:hypothetical protein